MPQALVPVLASIGIKGIAATIVSTVAVAGATSFVSSLLKPGAPKPDASERTLRSPTPSRIFILGHRRSYGASMLFANTALGSTVDVWAYAEGPIHAVTATYLNDDKVIISGGVVQPIEDGAYGSGKVFAGHNMGAAIETAHAPIVSRFPDWTEDHRGDGICSGYLVKESAKSKDYLDIYPQGDNVDMSLAIQGRLCHDPRQPESDPYDPLTWGYSDNSALELLWFYTAFLAEDYATVIAPVEDMWIAAANDCDNSQALSAGGTEPKYRGWVMFNADAEPQDIESEIKATFDGWTARDESGCIRVYSGKVYTPTLRIGPEHIIDYEVQKFVEAENSINETIVRHVSIDHDFNIVEPQPWRNDGEILASGRLVSSPLELQVPSHTQARRIAKRKEARSNASHRGKVRTLFSARDALLERYIDLAVVDAGSVFFEGVAEVLGGEIDPDTGGAIIEWSSVDPNTDAWNPATEDGQPAPTTTKPYASPLETPLIISATANFSDIGESSGIGGETITGVRVYITASGPVRDDLTWFARWRLGTGVWTEREYTDADPGPGVTLVTDYVPYGTTVTVQAAYSTGDGRISPWSLGTDVDTSP